MKTIRNISIALLCVMLVGCGTSGTKKTSTKTSDSTTTSATSDADYSVATGIKAAKVEDFATKVRTAILEQNWKQIARMCDYPITIGKKKYKTSSALENAKITLSSKFLAAIKAEDCSKMFVNSKGIMMGSDGEVWIGEVLDDNMKSQGLRIIAINID